MANYYSKQPKRSKEDPMEVKLVLAVLRGIIKLFTWPFRGKPRVEKRRAQPLDTQEVSRRWADIQTSLGLGGTTHFGSAVVAADKLLDYVLRQKGYAGETMGERLRNAQSDMSPSIYHGAWQAHKLRNQLVHEVEGEVLSFQAKEAIGQFEQALRELGALR